MMSVPIRRSLLKVYCAPYLRERILHGLQVFRRWRSQPVADPAVHDGQPIGPGGHSRPFGAEGGRELCRGQVVRPGRASCRGQPEELGVSLADGRGGAGAKVRARERRALDVLGSSKP
jgi:hypothetical protein